MRWERCIFVQNITKAGFQYKPLLFFLFFGLDFINYFWNFWWYSRIFCIKTWKPWVVFMKCGKSKILKPILVPRLGPRTSAPVLGPSLGTKWVSIFLIFALHETTQGFKFSCKNIRETTKNFQKNLWNQDTKKKRAVST